MIIISGNKKKSLSLLWKAHSFIFNQIHLWDNYCLAKNDLTVEHIICNHFIMLKIQMLNEYK